MACCDLKAVLSSASFLFPFSDSTPGIPFRGKSRFLERAGKRANGI